jgi:hypothetical protein
MRNIRPPSKRENYVWYLRTEKAMSRTEIVKQLDANVTIHTVDQSLKIARKKSRHGQLTLYWLDEIGFFDSVDTVFKPKIPESEPTYEAKIMLTENQKEIILALVTCNGNPSKTSNKCNSSYNTVKAVKGRKMRNRIIPYAVKSTNGPHPPKEYNNWHDENC